MTGPAKIQAQAVEATLKTPKLSEASAQETEVIGDLQGREVVEQELTPITDVEKKEINKQLAVIALVATVSAIVFVASVAAMISAIPLVAFSVIGISAGAKVFAGGALAARVSRTFMLRVIKSMLQSNPKIGQYFKESKESKTKLLQEAIRNNFSMLERMAVKAPVEQS
ncbi:MAG: hypothetical protein HN831_03125 [Waddliaceae bacterium]|jgi:hypothetical protein|nr:hypothetical protein [Waddliaceae bacterium]